MRWPLGILLLSVACGGSKGRHVAKQAKLLSERPTSAGLVEQLVDVNGDGERDVINFFRERSETTRLLVRKEVDLNWDGKIDVRTWFDDDGNIERGVQAELIKSMESAHDLPDSSQDESGSNDESLFQEAAMLKVGLPISCIYTWHSAEPHRYPTPTHSSTFIINMLTPTIHKPPISIPLLSVPNKPSAEQAGDH